MDVNWLDLVLRWLHILPAMALGGGLIFLCFAWSSTSDVNPFGTSWEQVRSHWTRLVAICSGLLLVTGLINAVRNILDYDFAQPGYHALVAVKLLLGLAIMAIAALLAGRSTLAQKIQQRTAHWLLIAALLVVAIVMVGGWMKDMDRTAKSPTTQITATH